MTPAARIQAAIEVLDDIDVREAPADRITASYMRARRYIGAKDRRAILARVYDVIRNREALDWWLARAKAEPSARLRLLAYVALDAADGDAAALFTGTGHGPALLSDAERRIAAALAGQTLYAEGQPPRVLANCPEWVARLLARRFGLDFRAEAGALNDEAPFDLRVNLLKTTRERALQKLASHGITGEPTRLSPWGIRVPARKPVAGLAAYKNGLIEIQDEGSQIVALLTDARPGQFVVDFCAGGGGKTLALAAMMANKGALAALDVSARLNAAAPRFARSGAKIISARRITGGDLWLAENAGKADRVLVDAPCTGVGAWRRDPAARFRLTRAELDRLTALQREILDRAARLVRPGGRLVYATCSLLAEENEDQAAWFAETHADFTLLPAAEIWNEPAPVPAEGPYLVLTPARFGTDGFFAAVFERRSLGGGAGSDRLWSGTPAGR